ncbi:MAG: hypothetical protein IJJ67_09445 [Oscillospiraceae bacterium]|nr:hypothetical protein [Oscillospiraceae bacterium]
MKTRITDLVQDCYPEDIDIGEFNEEITLRILDSVQNRLGTNNSRPRRIRKLSRALLLAAALVLVLGTAAFAIAEYTLSLRKPAEDEELVSGFRYEEVVDGEVRNSEILAYPDAGMVFSFSCPEEQRFTPEFRCFWVPQEATEGITDEQGWTKRLFCGSENEIPYSITTIDYIRDGFQLILNGDVEIIKEEYLGDWQILEATSDYSSLAYQTYDRANYILLFDKTTGYLILISGESDMETLEHIAYEMEIRESSIPRPEYSGGPAIGLIDLARG